MTQYDPISFKHAILNRDLEIMRGHIVAFMKGQLEDKTWCTHIYTVAGVFPTTETIEQITEKVSPKPKIKEEK